MNPILYAHSGRPEKDKSPAIPPQTYQDHIENVRKMAIHYAEQVEKYCCPTWRSLLKNVAQLSGEFHDLGKLDEMNQSVLGRDGSGGSLPFNHVDAGIAHLTLLKPNCVDHLLGLYVIHAHHRGLEYYEKERKRKPGKEFRDYKLTENSSLPISSAERSNEFLCQYLDSHQQTISPLPFEPSKASIDLKQAQLFLRLSLSCLADADHGDTARYYQRKPNVKNDPSILYPAERRQALDQYVQDLSNKAEKSARNQVRQEVYQACRTANTNLKMVECDSPVGTGKTTAVMAHLLNVAKKHNLRRIFVVLPFTNIIQQSAEIYRQALLLKGELPEQIIGEHHHKAEFQSVATRQFTYLWQTPIVVTTAVQFFETLASKRPSALRKLHRVPGSAIFIDEAHAALPPDLLPQAWQWMEQLQKEWGCHFVFGSGSLTRFWEVEDLADEPKPLPPLIPASIRGKSHSDEKKRITFETIEEPLDLSNLLERIVVAPGPRLVIVNTVQSAAVIAQKLRQENHNVLHLSTALTPNDRAKTIEKIKQRLEDNTKFSNWTLVATSCVEAGVDFSFRSGFRERCSLTSLLQASGRVNRNNEYEHSIVRDFSLLNEEGITEHPGFKASAKILKKMFESDKIAPEYVTWAMQKEVRENEGKLKRKENLRKAESSLNFPEVETLFQVIEADTRTAIVDEELQKRLLQNVQNENISFQEIQNHSVQIWSNKIRELALQEIVGYSEMYFWTLKYDSFLGYMAGVLEMQNFVKNGGSIL